MGMPDERDDTSPIELATGRRARFGAKQTSREPVDPDQDAPEVTNRSNSTLVRGLVDTVLEASKAEGIDPNMQRRLKTQVQALAILAEKGLSAKARSGGAVAVIGTVLACLGITLGVPTLSSTDDVAQARVQSEQNAEEIRTLKAEHAAFVAADAEKERAMRRNMGLTIRWLGDEQKRACWNSNKIAEGVNWLVKREIKATKTTEDDDEYRPIEIDCETSDLIPPELDQLRADAPYPPRPVPNTLGLGQ